MGISTDYKTMTVSELLERIKEKKYVLPHFQRDIVWTDKKRKLLIDSLRSHYPIGSLLLAEVEETVEGIVRKRWQIIDGLQRTNAIMQYSEEPEKFVDREWIEPIWMNNLKSLVLECTNENPKDDDVREVLFKLMLKPGNRDSADLIKGCMESFGGNFDVYSSDANSEKLKDIVASINESLKIDSIKIPYIEFVGSPQERADAFEKLNTGSVALNKYQIAAAQWSKECRIENQEVKNEIKEYWLSRLQNADHLEIDGIDENGNPETYLLFDILTGLRRKLTKESKTVLKAEWEEQIGFQVACLALERRLGEIAQIESLLPQEDSKVSVDGLIQAMTSAFRQLEKTFKPILGLTLNSTQEAQFQGHANLLVGSMAAALMTEAGKSTNNWNGQIKERTPVEKSSLRSWYLSDFLKGSWGNAGDTLAFNRVWRPVEDTEEGSQRFEAKYFYNESPSHEIVDLSLDGWFEDEMQREHAQRKIISSETKLVLRFFYATKNNFFDEHDKIFHIDHLIPIQWWKDLSNTSTDGYRGPINSIGNLCLMETEVHSTKTTKLPFQWFEAQTNGNVELAQQYIDKYLLVEPESYKDFKPVEVLTQTGSINSTRLAEIDELFRQVSRHRWTIVKDQVLQVLQP